MFKAYDSYTKEESQLENEQELMEFAKVYADRINEEKEENESLVTVNDKEEAINVLESAMIWVTEKQSFNIKKETLTMTGKFRLMTADEMGEVIINELFEDYDEAETEYDKQVLNNDTKEVVLDEVFFDKNNEWLEDNDKGLLAWREEGY